MTQKKAWFKDWFNSPYYHQLYNNRDEQEAANFIDQLIDYLQPAIGATMLDVACGKGRHSIQLAAKGFDVTGIDLSEESILEALKSETNQLHFYKHDMRLPFRINYYDFVFNFFTSFGYFNTAREHHHAIRTMNQAVKHQGCFVMDYLNIQYSEAQLIPFEKKIIEGVQFSITKWFDATHFYKKIEVEDAALKTPLVYEEKVARFTLQDFTQMLAVHQLDIKEVFGDYKFSSYDETTSPRLIMIASKK